MKKTICACCENEIKSIFDKHNPEPVFQEKGTVVCSDCNKKFIIPARKNILKKQNENELENFFNLETDKDRFAFLMKRGYFNEP